MTIAVEVASLPDTAPIEAPFRTAPDEIFSCVHMTMVKADTLTRRIIKTPGYGADYYAIEYRDAAGVLHHSSGFGDVHPVVIGATFVSPGA